MAHKHHWIIGSPSGTHPWSLATCKVCNQFTVMKNWGHQHTYKLTEPDSINEFEFLESLGFPPKEIAKALHKSQDFREVIVASVQQHGVKKTSMRYSMPTSTVGLWAKGYSVNKAPSDKYTTAFRKRTVAMALDTGNIRRTALQMGVPRSTLQSWIRKGVLYDSNGSSAFAECNLGHFKEGNPERSGSERDTRSTDSKRSSGDRSPSAFNSQRSDRPSSVSPAIPQGIGGGRRL